MLLVGVTLLIACTGRTALLEMPCDLFEEDQHYTWEVAVSAGDSVVVRPCTDPTTGFAWKALAEIGNPSVLEQARNQNVVGSAGRAVWTFKALSKGTTRVSMEYGRP